MTSIDPLISSKSDLVIVESDYFLRKTVNKIKSFPQEKYYLILTDMEQDKVEPIDDRVVVLSKKMTYSTFVKALSMMSETYG